MLNLTMLFMSAFIFSLIFFAHRREWFAGHNYELGNFSLWLKQKLEHLENKTVLTVRTFQNKYQQPVQSMGWNGGIKAFLDKISPAPHWEKTQFHPFGPR